MKNQENVILNKQYSKEEYEKILDWHYDMENGGMVAGKWVKIHLEAEADLVVGVEALGRAPIGVAVPTEVGVQHVLGGVREIILGFEHLPVAVGVPPDFLEGQEVLGVVADPDAGLESDELGGLEVQGQDPAHVEELLGVGVDAQRLYEHRVLSRLAGTRAARGRQRQRRVSPFAEEGRADAQIDGDLAARLQVFEAHHLHAGGEARLVGWFPPKRLRAEVRVEGSPALRRWEGVAQVHVRVDVAAAVRARVDPDESEIGDSLRKGGAECEAVRTVSDGAGLGRRGPVLGVEGLAHPRVGPVEVDDPGRLRGVALVAQRSEAETKVHRTEARVHTNIHITNAGLRIVSGAIVLMTAQRANHRLDTDLAFLFFEDADGCLAARATLAKVCINKIGIIGRNSSSRIATKSSPLFQ